MSASDRAAAAAAETPEDSDAVAAPVELWEEVVGFPPDVITVYERADRGGVLYLKRWDVEAGNWRRKSLKRTLRDKKTGAYLKPRALAAEKAWAIAEAKKWHAKLTGAAQAAEPAPAPPFTVSDAWAHVSDPAKGPLRTKTRGYANEVKAALGVAARVWGSDRAWNTVRKADLRQLGRARVEELAANPDVEVGYRAAEITVARVVTVANWLRDDELIDEDACVPPKRWKAELREFWTTYHKKAAVPEPERPRHEADEVRRIREQAWVVDPRLGLALEIGAELRVGQVRRVMRSHLELDSPVAPHGRVTVHGKGRKRGAVVHLTRGQRAGVDRALTGYLARLEAAYQAGTLTDYPLFPAGQMKGGRKGEPVADPVRHGAAGPIHSRALLAWFHEAEGLAKVTPQPGRGFYGARRVGVDGAKQRKVAPDTMKELGGWADTQVPDTIYADAESTFFREEARRLRELLRGEQEADAPAATESPAESPAEPASATDEGSGSPPG